MENNQIRLTAITENKPSENRSVRPNTPDLSVVAARPNETVLSGHSGAESTLCVFENLTRSEQSLLISVIRRNAHDIVIVDIERLHLPSLQLTIGVASVLTRVPAQYLRHSLCIVGPDSVKNEEREPFQVPSYVCSQIVAPLVHR